MNAPKGADKSSWTRYIPADTSLIALDEGVGGGPKARRFFVT